MSRPRMKPLRRLPACCADTSLSRTAAVLAALISTPPVDNFAAGGRRCPILCLLTLVETSHAENLHGGKGTPFDAQFQFGIALSIQK